MKKILLSLFIALPLLTFCQTQANLLGTWSNPDLPSSNAFDNTYNEIWGIAAGGTEYAIIGSTNGTHFIDLADPTNPTETFFVEGAATGSSIIHRDYHDYQCYLYAVADEGNSTLQIIDISDLPNSVEVVYESDEFFKRTHNIFIDTTHARLYTLSTNGGSLGNTGMAVFDISDPVNPQFLAKHSLFGNTTVNSVHDAYFRDNIGYLNCGGLGLLVVDFTDAINPVLMGTLSGYAQAGYNHSGWLSDDGSHYFLADETHGTDVKSVSVDDFTDMEITSFFDAGPNTPASSIAHNLLATCNYLYVAYYYDGLQIYDISDPANPSRAFFYPTSNESPNFNFKGAWGVYPFLPSGNILVADMQEGLFVIESVDNNCPGILNNTACSGVSSVANPEQTIRLNVFPQPVDDVLNIQIEVQSAHNNTLLTLTDLMGKTILTKTVDLSNGLQTIQLEQLNRLPQGYYLLNISSEQLNSSQKVLISH